MQKKLRCYRYDSDSELKQLVKKFGEGYFNFVPNHGHEGGYLYCRQDPKGSHGGYTTVSREEFRDGDEYSDCIEIPFKESMKTTVEEQIQKGLEVIGKDNLFYSNGRDKITKSPFIPDKVAILKKGQGSYLVDEYIRKNKLDYCVAIIKDGSSIPVEILVDKPTSKTIKLTDDYNATVYADKVVVGCQTIPLDTVKELVKIAAELKQ